MLSQVYEHTLVLDQCLSSSSGRRSRCDFIYSLRIERNMSLNLRNGRKRIVV